MPGDPSKSSGPDGNGAENGNGKADHRSTVRFKVAPEPRDLNFLAAAQGAIPLVPDDVEDCCARLLAETDVESRDAAREYVTFLRALELVEGTPRGYRRSRVDPDRERLATEFERRVFGAAEVLAAMEGGEALRVDEAFEALRERVPRWERDRHVDWEREWRERTGRLLRWADTFGLVVREGEAFRPTDPDS